MQADTAEQTTEAAESSPDTANGKRHRMPRQGNVHATIFENHGANGAFYSASFQPATSTRRTRATHEPLQVDRHRRPRQAGSRLQQKIAELSQGRSR